MGQFPTVVSQFGSIDTRQVCDPRPFDSRAATSAKGFIRVLRRRVIKAFGLSADPSG
jgi:hypothetical protein